MSGTGDVKPSQARIELNKINACPDIIAQGPLRRKPPALSDHAKNRSLDPYEVVPDARAVHSARKLPFFGFDASISVIEVWGKNIPGPMAHSG